MRISEMPWEKSKSMELFLLSLELALSFVGLVCHNILKENNE